MNNKELSKILQTIKADELARNHFFRKLETAKNPFSLLKPLKDNGYFDGKYNPEPVEDLEHKGYYSIPYWIVLGFLDNVSKQNGKNPDSEITQLLLQIIDSITSWINPKTGQRVDNYHTDRYMLNIISNLPIEYISEKHVRLLETFLRSKFGVFSISSEISETILSKLIEHKKKQLLLILLEIIFDFDVNQNSDKKRFKPLMEIYWLGEAVRKYKEEISKICATEAINLVLRKIESILKIDRNMFNCISIPSIEEHEQNWRTDSYEYQLVFFIRDMFGLSESKEVRANVEDLLKKDHSIFKRLGLFAIDKHYKDMKELFWVWKENPLYEIECERELYNLIERHCEDFSEIEVLKYLNWIESMIFEDEDNKAIIAYRKKRWLWPFKEKEKFHDHEIISKLYENYDRINPIEIDHPGWLSWHEECWGHEEAFDEKEFLAKTTKEQVEFLNNYQFEKGWRKPEQNDVAYKLQQTIAEQPQIFVGDIMAFWELKRDSDKLALLRGIRDAWDKGKGFTWEEILIFCEKIIKEPDFWAKEYEANEYNYRREFIQGICDLLITGMCKDSHAFEESLLSNAEAILLDIGQKTRIFADKFPEKKKPTINNVINSVRYDVFSAIMNYALRYARLYSKENKVKYPKKIQNYFNVGLDKTKEPSLYYSVALGRYLVNLKYLDRNWVWTNINKIFPKDNEPHWKSAFMGYLSMGKVYKDIYLLLKEEGHYEQALQADFDDEYGNKYVVQHICIGYLGGDEILSDEESLISKLLTKDGVEIIENIIKFLHRTKKPKERKFSEKIKPLWKRLYELLKLEEDTPEYTSIIINLCSWLDEIDQIDGEVIEWVKFSIDHIKDFWDSYRIVEYLAGHVDKSPKAVGDLYIHLINRGFYPDIHKENIKRIVEVLYEKKLKEKADEICRLYQARGHEFLKEIYDMNNLKSSNEI